MNNLDGNCISYLNYGKVIANDHILPQMSLTGAKLRFINAKNYRSPRVIDRGT